MARGQIKVCPDRDGVSLDSRRFSLGELEALGYVTLGRGKVISKEDIKSTPGEYPVYSSSAVGSGEIGRYGLFMFDDERITWSIDGGGRLFYRPKHRYSVTNVCGWLKVNTPDISTRYLHLYLTARWQRLIFDYTYKAHPSVIRNAYKNLSFPDVQEQTRIASFFDKLEEVVAGRKSQLETLSNLVKSRFVEMFGTPSEIFSRWQTAKLGEIAFITKLAGFEYSKYIKYKDHGDIIMIRGLNCKKTHLVLDDIYWIDQETSDLLPRSKLSKGDLVFTYVGTVGEVAVVDRDRAYHLAPNVAKIELNDKRENNPYFYAHLLIYLREYVLKFAATTTQSALSMERIRKIPLPVPSASLQCEFAAFVAKVDKLAFAVRKSLETAEKLYRQQLSEAIS